jgi:hypothetical protein
VAVGESVREVGEHRRRLRCKHPTAAWTSQQIVEAFADRDAPPYLIRERDRIYRNEVRLRIASLHIEEVLTAPRSPWQHSYAERLMGSRRSDCLNHYVILNAKQLKTTLASYFAYYHGSRTHLGLDKQCPFPRRVSSRGMIIEILQLGGLHHRYERVAAYDMSADAFLANDRVSAYSSFSRTANCSRAFLHCGMNPSRNTASRTTRRTMILGELLLGVEAIYR